MTPSAEKADWAFGSGTHAITWVNKTQPGYYLELGQSWFRATQKLALTPGHRDAQGVSYRVFDPGAQILRCFSCHSTGPIEVNGSGEIRPAELGVNCEVCHGPGKAHLEAGGSKYLIGNPIRYRASAINEQCGACHRQPGGDANWNDPWNARHQPVYLAESRCFLMSAASAQSAGANELTCFTCHDPHGRLASTGYDAKCQTCHPTPKHRAAAQTRPATQTRQGCVACHMPRVNPMPDIGFANHWIGIYSPGNPLRPRR